MKVFNPFSLLFLIVFSPLLVAQDEGAAASTPEIIDCDEICASQVAEATRATNQEKSDLEAQLAPLKAALEQAKEASVSATAEVITLKGQLATMEGIVASAKSEAETIKVNAAQSEAAMDGKVKELEAELSTTKSKLADFESARYFINKELIFADFLGLFRKFGLFKKKVDEEDL